MMLVLRRPSYCADNIPHIVGKEFAMREASQRSGAKKKPAAKKPRLVQSRGNTKEYDRVYEKSIHLGANEHQARILAEEFSAEIT